MSVTTRSIGQKHDSILFNTVAIAISLAGIVMVALFQSESFWWRNLCLSPMFRYLQFFLFGVTCRKYSTQFFRLLDKNYFITAVICIFTTSLYLISSVDNIKTEYGIVGNLINDFIVRYTGLLIVVICFYKNRHFFETGNTITKILTLIGKRSLDIYMIHNFLLPNLSFLSPFLKDKHNLVLEFWFLLLLTALVISFALGIGMLLRNSRFLSKYLLAAKKPK